MSYIETARLDLREIYESDTESIYNNWCTDPEVTKYMTWEPHKSIEDTKEIMKMWLNDDKDRFVIVLRETNEIIGMIDIVRIQNNIPEIGYVSGRKWWGNGYMTEALEAFSEHLFAKGYKKLNIEAIVENIGSNRVIQKNEFTLVGTREMENKGETVTVNQYSKEDPEVTQEIDASFKKEEVNKFQGDLLKKMIKSPLIIMCSTAVLGVILIILGMTAFREYNFSTAFIVTGIIAMIAFVFNGALVIYMSRYVKKILGAYTAYAKEDGVVDIKIRNRKDYFKIILGNKDNIIEFKRSEIKSVSATKSAIMVNTIFGTVFLPNVEELKETFKVK